jgi:sugar lactone lactonase YvrE
VVVGLDGNIYVLGSYYNAHCDVYTPQGAFLRTFLATASQYNNGMIGGPDHNLYMSIGNQVVVEDYFGHVMGTVGGSGQLSAAGATAFDSKGNLYVVDLNNNRVMEYSAQYRFIRQFGLGGATYGLLGGATDGILGQLVNPQAIAVDASGNLYVFNGVTRQVMVFGPNGMALRSWNQPNDSVNQMKFDSNGYLWVLSGADTDIEIYDTNGNLRETIGGYGTAPGQFHAPVAFDFGASSNFFVLDQGLGQVTQFTSCGAAPPLGPATATPSPTPVPSQYLITRVSAGSSQALQDAQGNAWMGDQPFVPGAYGYTQGGTAFTSASHVAGTNSPALYRNYRAGSNLAFSFTLPAGHYQVNLKFADFLSTAKGQNVFNISINGVQVSSNVDIFAGAGADAASDRSFRVDSNGTSPLTIQLSAVAGQAFLSAIEIRGLQPDANTLVNYFVVPGGGALVP